MWRKNFKKGRKKQPPEVVVFFFFYFNKKKSLMVSIKMMLRIQTVQKKKNEAKETESHLIIQQLEHQRERPPF